MTDFSIYQDTERPILGGTCKKSEIQIEGTSYIIKYQSITDLGPLYNHISEYLGSHVFALLGIPVQDTILGTYKGKNVVLIKNFCGPGEEIITYSKLGEAIIEDHPEMFENVKEVIERYWDMFIIDALNGNSDRHGGNWGFIKTKSKYSIAPTFDNDCCLCPTFNTDEIISEILQSSQRMSDLIFSFPISQIKIDGKRRTYSDVINSLSYIECSNALERIVPRINLYDIKMLVDGIDNISDTRKRFYKTMYEQRYNAILLAAYKKIFPTNVFPNYAHDVNDNGSKPECLFNTKNNVELL